VKKHLRRFLLAFALLFFALQSALVAASLRWGNLEALYPQGLFHGEYVTFTSDRGVWRIHRFFASSLEGAYWSSETFGPFQFAKPFDRRQYTVEPNTWHELLLPGLDRTTRRGHHEWSLSIPVLWTLSLNLFPVALYLATRIRARRRFQAQPDLCQNCGYNLCATPDRCPKCGHRPSRSSAP
jgi:hypothetical protein